MKTKVKKKIHVLLLTLLTLHTAVIQGASPKSRQPTPSQPTQNNKNSNNPPLHEASILISELFFDPSSHGQGYIELYGEKNMSLTNYSIVIYGGPHFNVSKINLTDQRAHSDGAFVIGSLDTPKVDLITNTSILCGNVSILALYRNLDKGFNGTFSLTKPGLQDYVIYGIDNVEAYKKELRVLTSESTVLLKDRDEVLYSNGSFSKCYSSSSRDVRGFTLTKQTPGRKNLCPKVEPVINEVSLSETDDGCFVEVYTPMKKKTLLNSYIVVTFTQNDTDIRHNVYDLWNHVADDNGYFLLTGKGDQHNKMKLDCSQSFSGTVSAVVMYQVTGNLTDFVLKLPTDFHLQDALLFHTEDTEPNKNTSVLMSKLKQNSSYFIKDVTEFQAGTVSISRCNNSFRQSEPTPGKFNICKKSSQPSGKLTTTASHTVTKTPSSTTSTKSTPTLTKSTPTTTKSTPTSTKSTPTSTKTTPSSTKSTPTSTKSTPTSTKTTPTSTKSTPTSTKSTPTTTKSTPTSTKSTPTSTKTTPSSTKSTPTSTKSTPTSTKTTPTSTKSTSTSTKSTPTTTKSTPTSTKTTPSSTTKSTPTTTNTTLKPTTKTTLIPKSTSTNTTSKTTPKPQTTTKSTQTDTTKSTQTSTTKLTKSTKISSIPSTKTTLKPTAKTTLKTTPKPTTNSTQDTTATWKTTAKTTPKPTRKTTKILTPTTKTTLKPAGMTSKTTKMATTTTAAQTVTSKVPVTRPHTSISVFINEIHFATSGQISFIELNATGDYHSFRPMEYSVVIIDGTSGEMLYFITTGKGTQINNGLLIMNHTSVAIKNFPNKSFAVALYHKQMKKSDSIRDKSLVDAVVIKINDRKMNTKVTKMMHSNATVHFDMMYVKKKYSISRCSYKGRRDSGEFSWTKSTRNAKNANCHGVHPNPLPATDNDSNDKNIKVTVAVVVTCLAVFLVIVGILVIYMKRKQKAVLHFHLTPLDDYDEDLITNMEPVDQDDLLIGNEPTFSNNLYNKMQS